jgi:hypothetical protein
MNHPLLAGGVYSKVISGAELSSMSGRRAGWNGWIPRSYPGQYSAFRAYCGPIAGGISFAKDGDVDFTANGTLTVVGIRRDFRGYESSVTFGGPIRVINQASN